MHETSHAQHCSYIAAECSTKHFLNARFTRTNALEDKHMQECLRLAIWGHHWSPDNSHAGEPNSSQVDVVMQCNKAASNIILNRANIELE